VTAKYEIKSYHSDRVPTASDHRHYRWKFVGWDGEEEACVDPFAYNGDDYEDDDYDEDE